MGLDFVILGCGRIGNRHAQHAANNGRVLACVDTDMEAANSLAADYGANPYYSFQDFLSSNVKADVVAVCTPNGLHAEHSILALNHGYHVLCEKPMALSVYDCGEMIKAAEKNNRRLFVVKQNRYNPPVQKVKELIDKGVLGKVLSLQLNCFWNRNPDYYKDSWKGSRSLDGGILYTQYSHFIDLVYWLVGDIKEVKSMVGNLSGRTDIEFEDTVVASCIFHSGAFGSLNFTINAFEKNMEGSITLFCEKGTVKIGGQYLNELEYQSIDGMQIEGLPAGNPPNNYGKYQGSMSNHDKVYENVNDVLNNNGIITTNGFEGLKTVEIIDKIYSAGQNN